jgi:hypothetical protein
VNGPPALIFKRKAVATELPERVNGDAALAPFPKGVSANLDSNDNLILNQIVVK